MWLKEYASLNQSVKSSLGLLITALAVAAKLAAYINKSTAAVFDNSVVTVGLLVLMALGLFMFAYYSMPERLIKNPAESQVNLQQSQES